MGQRVTVIEGMTIPMQSTSPVMGGLAVTTSDSTDLAAGSEFRALWVGVTGNIKVKCLDDSVVTFSNVPVGFFPVGCKRVYTTGTTASSLIGVW